jgi:hypothetical protein
MTTGRCVLYDDADLLVAVKCYYDGSYGDDASGDSWITLGGVAATDSTWADFDTEWNRMLSERYPVAPYIHMIELMGHNDPFDYGWDRTMKRQLISDAIVALSQMDKDEFRWFRFSINENAIGRLLQQGEYAPADPHKMLVLLLAEFMVTPYWINSQVNGGTPENIFLYYDRDEQFMSGIKKEWLARRTRPGRPKNSANVWDRIENILDVDQAFTPPLQVSDMVAWAHNRTLPTDEEREFSDLKELLIKFVPSTNLDVTEEVMRHQGRLVKESVR